MVPNRRDTTCPVCNGKAEMRVNPDDWEDAPKSFTLTVECSRGCPKKYTRMTPEQVRELGVATSGWSNG